MYELNDVGPFVDNDTWSTRHSSPCNFRRVIVSSHSISPGHDSGHDLRNVVYSTHNSGSIVTGHQYAFVHGRHGDGGGGDGGRLRHSDAQYFLQIVFTE